MTFKESKLSNLCEIISSKRVFAASYQSEGIPFFRGKEISQLARGEKTTAELYISEDVYADVVSRTGPINPGDILLTAVGTLGNPYQVKDADLPFYFKDGNIVWLRTFSKEINSTFLFYWLNSQYGRRKVLDTAIGSTQAALTITGLGAIAISCPNLAQQNGIVRILSAIDQKIAMNNALSKTLEDVAQTIFKSWFIDFDPVKAKMAGEKPAGVDEATAALFPNSMEESEFGLIPKGWEVRTIDSLTTCVVGGTPSRAKEEYWNGVIPWVNSGKINEFRIT
jgi:type I restriction enzyme S subunit